MHSMISPASLTAAALAVMPAGAQELAPLLQPGETLVQVSATGEVKAVPDLAAVSTGITADGGSAEAALAANAERARQLIAALRSAGVPERAIRTSNLSVRPRYRRDKDDTDTDQVIGYRATNQLSVRVTAMDAGHVIDQLVQAGASEVDGPRFSFSNEAALARQARASAVHDAQQRGRDYADAFGLTALRVVRVNERRADAEGGGDIIVTGTRKGSPVLPGEQAVSVTVWVDYAAGRSITQ